jgi:hypothetical protein
MTTSDRLRYELLAALTTGGLLVACGGKTGDDVFGSGGTGGSIGGSGGVTTGGFGGISTGGTGGIATGGSGGISTGGVGGISTGGVGGISTGGTGGQSNPIIIGTIDCSYNCNGNWLTCWQAGTVPVYEETPPDPGGFCPQGYEIDQTQFSPCSDEFYGLWYSGPVAVDGMEGYCCYDSGVMCPGGRPFRVEGELRVAAVCQSRDWSDTEEREMDLELDENTRRALGKAWLCDAQLEHASVAAFARLTLQLMALGAPAELVEESQRASLDEIAHAKACFGMASRYLDGVFGPSSLRLDGALSDLGLEALLTSSIEEGCIGETLAAMIAGEQARVSLDARVKQTFEQIARDESRHAALAWRIVRWALERDPSLRRVAARAFEEMLTRATSTPFVDPVGIAPTRYRAHGRLTASQLDATRAEAVSSVIRPCLRQLLGDSDGAHVDYAIAG